MVPFKSTFNAAHFVLCTSNHPTDRNVIILFTTTTMSPYQIRSYLFLDTWEGSWTTAIGGKLVSEWDSGVNGMRSSITPVTGYAHSLELTNLPPVLWENLKSRGRNISFLPASIECWTCGEGHPHPSVHISTHTYAKVLQKPFGLHSIPL